MAKSKFFRAFVAGQTISDGRQIDPAWIDQIVSTFNTDNYTPRINIEHLSGYSPEPPFNGYGNVVAVKAQDDDFTIDGKIEKRRALYAQVDGNDQLADLVKKGQKPFPSVELTDSYAGTNKVGLIGLAFTDKPASIGTQALQFSRSAPGSLFSASEEAVSLEFEPANDGASLLAGIRQAITDGFARFARTDKEEVKPPVQEAPKPANDNDFSAFATVVGEQIATAIGQVDAARREDMATLRGEFAQLKGEIEKAPDRSFKRAPATGGNTAHVTDC